MRTTFLFLPFLMLSLIVSGQADLTEVGYDYFKAKNGAFEEVNIEASDLRISAQHKSSISGVTHIYFQQQHNGIDIVNHMASVHIDGEGQVRHATNRLFEANRANALSSTSFSDQRAIDIVAAHFDLPKVGETTLLNKEADSKKGTYENTAYSKYPIRTNLVYIVVGNELRLVNEVIIDLDQRHEKWATYIDARNGSIVRQDARFLTCDFGTPEACAHDTDHDHHTMNHADLPLPTGMMNNSYNVYAIPLEAPNEGDRSIVTEPWTAAPNASPFGWHDTDGAPGAEFTITSGNNVFAFEDLAGNNQIGTSPDGGASLVFDYPLDVTMSPLTYTDAAIVNLFYMNNIMHDVLYQYGLDEAAGNYQVNTYGNGGIGGDAVRAEAQDGSDTNNARFFFSPDGVVSRMEMYQWIPSFGGLSFEVTAPGNVAGTYEARKATFGPQVAMAAGTVVLSEPNTACDPITNPGAIAGNIAMIDRGDCAFTQKVSNAQAAGAIAVVMCNNNPGEGPITMNGTDASITIPSIMLSLEDCEVLKVELGSGLEVSMDLTEVVNTDSDLDNGIIAHEYGHGVSTRLTGGAGNVGCLNGDEQMGEGWSDYLALILQLKPSDMANDRNGIGTYVLGDTPLGNGIRPFPYSRDLNVNPMTYSTAGTVSVPHGVGSVWCTMLWDMTWNLIDKHGYEADVYSPVGGNGIALSLVMEGMKLQPCSPGFVDGRDAILLADEMLYGGENQCEIWEAFARRGLGVNADQGSVGSASDGTEDFTRPDCEPIGPCTDQTITYDNETIPDGTNKRVKQRIFIENNSAIASGTNVTLRSGNGLEMNEFTIQDNGVLFYKSIDCDNTTTLQEPPTPNVDPRERTDK